MHSLDARPIEDLIREYLAADYQWSLQGQWLNLKIGEVAPQVDAAFAQATRFGFVTAWDPASVVRPEAVNLEADARLHTLLVEAGLVGVPAFASGPNRTWRERSWLVPDIDAAALDALAIEFGQLATLYWDRAQPVRMRMYAARPDGCAEHDAVDWLK